MSNLSRRVAEIEKELGIEDNPQWLCLPDHDNPGQEIEFKGCRTFVDLVATAAKWSRYEQSIKAS
jgi:hypothetical protein